MIYCILCFRSEVDNDPINLESISALKKSVKRRTAAVNYLAFAYAFLVAMKLDSPCGGCFFKNLKMLLNKFYITWQSCKFQLVMHCK